MKFKSGLKVIRKIQMG